MKKIDLGQTVSILANIGVITGIVFLALQLQQSNKLLLASAVDSALEARLDRQDRMLENVDLAALLERNATQEMLSPEDVRRMQALHNLTFLGWEKDYFLYRDGILPEEYFRSNFAVMKGAFTNDDGVVSVPDYWQRWSPTGAAPAYRSFIEQCIYEDCDAIP